MNNSRSISNRLLTIFFAFLLAIEVLYTLIGFASIPLYYQRVTSQTIEPVVYSGAVQLSNEIVAQSAVDGGVSLGQYAVLHIIFNAAAAFIPLVVAGLIVWRARWNWFAWFTAFIIVFLGQASISEQTLVSQFISLAALGANDIFWFIVLLYIFLFPDGKVVPRRAGWLVGSLFVYHFFIQAGTVIDYAAPDLAIRLGLPNWGQSVFIIPVMLNFILVLACQIYRYRRVSTAVERQQSKWFLFGFALIVALVAFGLFINVTGRGGLLIEEVMVLLWLPLSISLAIAILRYRLFDINVIIRKTLVYAVLSGLLVLVYFGSVLLLQSMFVAVSGQQSPIAIVISTLIIAALFSSLRRRVQVVIDRRFFRQKYDAQQVLSEFAVTARDETDMGVLTAELVHVVQETMQPQQVGLWLKK